MASDLLKDLIYGEQLVTAGCKVDFAVGMTYSLNLEAMLTAALAIGELGELDGGVKQNPVFLLEGIRRCGDKVALFCNKGGIEVPGEARTLYSLLETSIFEVQDGSDVLSNFHPKMWLVKERDEDGGEWLKLSVMSRNLSFSTCLDICCTIRGRIGDERSERGAAAHRPLKDMLEWLSEYAQAKAEEVRKMAGLLDYVDHFELDEPFLTEGAEQGEEEGYGFFPFVYGQERFAPYVRKLGEMIRGERMMVVSPFIDTKTLEWLTARKSNRRGERANAVLLTRSEFVTEEVFNLFDEVYVPNETMVDNTTAQVDLHSKMYLVERGRGSDKEPVGRDGG